MKAIVIYKSSTGFTKKYAHWIAQELSCKAIPAADAKGLDWNSYDAVIYGGWFFAGSIKGYSDFKEKLHAFHGKKAVFAVGSMASDIPEAANMLQACFTAEEQSTMGTFYLQGGLDYAQMGFVHKAMMKMMCKMMKKQKGADSTEYLTISQSFDATDKNTILPIIDYITA